MPGSKTILLDTNLLPLFVVGLVGHDSIKLHKRTQAYEREDFELLRRFMSQFQETAVTPNILTETSNLLCQTGGPLKNKVMHKLRALVPETHEHYVRSKDAVTVPEFLTLGLADCGTLHQASSVDCVLTDDLHLYLALSRVKTAVINFNHIRAGSWFGRG